MRKTSFLYRFLAIITVLTVLGSISLPACLYAKNRIDGGGACPIASAHHSKNMAKRMGGGVMHMPSQHQMLYQSRKQFQKRGMDKSMSCCYFGIDYNFNGLFLKSETVASTQTQTKVILPVAAFDFTAESRSTERTHEIPPPNLKAPPPPVFLINCTFLN